MNPDQPPHPDRFPTFRKLAQFSHRRVIPAIHSFRSATARLFFSRTSAKVYLTTATLITLFYTGSRWYGRRLLDQEKQRIAALGMATDWAQLRQPLPAEGENFFSAPPFEGAFGDTNRPASPQLVLWLKTKAVPTQQRDGHLRYTHPPTPKNLSLEAWCAYFRLTGSLPHQTSGKTPAEELLSDEKTVLDIQAIFQAAKRSVARFPLKESNAHPHAYFHHIPISALNDMKRCLTLYGIAQLEANHPAEALPVFQVTGHLAQAYLAESGISMSLCANGVIRSQSTLLREGLIRHAWPAEVLTTIMARNYPALMQVSSRRAYEADRLATTEVLENYDKTLLPLKESTPWEHFLWEDLAPDYYYINAAILNSKFNESCHAALKPLEANEFWLSRSLSQPEEPTNFGPVRPYAPFYDLRYYPIMLHAVPVMHATLQHLAAALEMHFLENGRYPSALDQLFYPASVPSVPLKDMDGQPIRYTTDGAGSFFTLRSVGEDGQLDPVPPFAKDIVFSTSREFDSK